MSFERVGAGYLAPDTNSIACSNWFRSSGNSGWRNVSYGGGIYMEDTTWVRVHGSKSFYVSNQIAATGNITAYYSDERLKERKGEIKNAIDKVKSLDAFYYVENETAKKLGYNNNKRQVGLSAQQVKKVMPEVVSLAPIDMKTTRRGKIISESGENYLTVNYQGLTPLMIQAIKDQQEMIEELRAEIKELKRAV